MNGLRKPVCKGLVTWSRGIVELRRDVLASQDGNALSQEICRTAWTSTWNCDWATSKATRKSASAGYIFLNGARAHSHCRARARVALSSMEVEILAATERLIEGVAATQALQFLLRCKRDLANSNVVALKLHIDRASAQSFFHRLGPAKAKHLSTRMMWTQDAMRSRWFKIARISARNNPADLNT